MDVTNEDVARILRNTADLIDMKGEECFKVVAYQKAARAVGYLPMDLREYAREGELQEIPNVGKSIVRMVGELLETERLRRYEELLAELPDGVLKIVEVPGIGPKTALRIAQELGVSTVEGLEKAIVQGRLAQIPRMGGKTGEDILRHIQSRHVKSDRIPLAKSLPVAVAVCAAVRPYVGNVTAGGRACADSRRPSATSTSWARRTPRGRPSGPSPTPLRG